MTKQEWLNKFSERLKEEMLRAKFTINELSINSGIPSSRIQTYLSKKNVPSVESVLAIAYALGVKVEYLIDFGDAII